MSSVEIFQTGLLGKKVKIFSLSMKGVLDCIVQSMFAPSQKVIAVLEGRPVGRTAASFASILATEDAPLFSEKRSVSW